MQFISNFGWNRRCEQLKIPQHIAIAFDGRSYVDLVSIFQLDYPDCLHVQF